MAGTDLSAYPRKELADALLQAARYGEDDDVQIVRDLLGHDATLVNEQDDQGRTALHMASANGHDQVLTLLLQAKPDKTRVTNEGSTPLHYAAAKGCEKCVKQLIQHGYEVTAKNKFGRKPIDDCWDKGFQSVENALLMKDTEVDAELAKQQAKLDPDDLKGMDEAQQEQQQQQPRTGYTHAAPQQQTSPAALPAQPPAAQEGDNEEATMMDME